MSALQPIYPVIRTKREITFIKVYAQNNDSWHVDDLSKNLLAQIVSRTEKPFPLIISMCMYALITVGYTNAEVKRHN